MVVPAQLNLEREKFIEENIEMYIPYRWVRHFNEAKAMNEEERQAVIEFIKRELRKEIAQYVYYVTPTQWSRDAYTNHHENVPDFSSFHIQSITIKGFASPEGEGVASILGKEEKNTHLGAMRAENMEPLIREALIELGLDPSTIEVSGEEASFSDIELTQLSVLATHRNYGVKNNTNENVPNLQEIYELIRVYNREKTKLSPEEIVILDTIVGSKRNVLVEVDIEGVEKKVVVVPLPWLLLLPLLQLIPKGKEEEKKSDTDEPLETAPRQIFSEKTEHEENLEKENPNFYDRIRAFQKDENFSYEKRQTIEDLVLTDEIGRYYDDEESSRFGLDYREIVRDSERLINKNMPKYNWEEEITEKITENLLDSWQQYDRNVRRGIKTVDGQPLPVETNLEYRHDISKIAWAFSGAQHIIDLIKRAKEYQKNIDGELENQTVELLPEETIEHILCNKIIESTNRLAERGNSPHR